MKIQIKTHLITLMMLSQTAMAQEFSLSLETGENISWPTQEGRTYQLQSSTNSGESWENVGNVVNGDGSIQSHLDASTENGEIYRVIETSSIAQSAVSNGGFEEGTGPSISSWSLSGSSIERSNTEANSGTYSAHSNIENDGATPSSGQISQTISAVGGESYDFSFWAREVRNGVSYVQQYSLEWLDSNGDVISGTGIKSFDTETEVWTEISENLTAPAGVVNARINFRFTTGAVSNDVGEVYIDDVSLDLQTVESAILPVTINGVTQVSWPTEIGASYQLFSSDNLSDWFEEGGEVQGDGQVASFKISMEGRRMFYRAERTQTITPIVTDIVSLYDADTVLDPELQEETEDALITYMGDRARDRHAREDQFQAYDHYLPFYWEERTLNLEIIDRVAKGGTDITFNYTTQARLGAPEFRAFYLGENTVAEYHLNLLAPEVGPNQYTATINSHQREQRPLEIGDLIEIEISQFLENAENGRNNYYGTTFLYIVGQGVVPWQAVGDIEDSVPMPEAGWLGGLTTLPYQYSDEPDNHFIQTAGNIAPVSIQPFMEGRRLHHTDFGDGSHSEPGNPIFDVHVGKLGPQFVAKSCVECHVNNGRSLTPAIGEPFLQGVIKVGSNALGQPHDILGKILQPRSTNGTDEGNVTISSYTFTEGTYADGTAYTLRKPSFTFSETTPSHFSVRYSQQLVGIGLLEAIDEATILAKADPDDENNDGISGRPQIILDPESGVERLGRFTHKAGVASIRHQVAAALNTDMGITTPIFPTLDDGTTTGTAEINNAELEEMNRYMALLGVSARRDLNDPVALNGERLFSSAGCADCHTSEIQTGSFHPMAELRNQKIHPYTDLLLHDMGSGLADNMGEGVASGSEWRTAPLWNIGLTSRVSGGEAYLHDGRARTLEEAVLWHGGEGEGAKENFRTMPAADREALIKFLKSL